MSVRRQRRRRSAVAPIVAAAGVAILPLPVVAQDPAPDDAASIHVLHVQGEVYMVHTPAGNMTVQAGPEGILVVDTLTAEVAERVYREIEPLSPKQIQYVVNTHADPAHTGGNARFAQLGRSVFGGNITGVVDRQAMDARARIISHENVLIAMSSADAPREFEAWPTDVFFTAKRELFFNGEGIQILHQPSAHTDGDSIAYFRGSDVISTGDLFNSHRFPIVDLEAGGTVQGLIDALNRIIDLALPALMQEGGTMIVPGHGRLCDEADVVEYRDMVVIVRDRIAAMVDRGLSLREVQAARPTLGYDWQYGRGDEDWTGEDFVAAIYRDLTRQ